MLTDTVLIAIGLALVAKGGDLFVDSSVQIGRALHVPRFIIGGTLVSLATTTPELVVSATASTIGDSGIALGNAIGSCICNIGLIVGTVSLMSSVPVDRHDFANRAAWMVGGAALVIGFTWNRSLGRPMAAVLLALAFAYLLWDVVAIRRFKAAGDESGTQPDDDESITRSVLVFVAGAGLILIGSRLLVTSGRELAAALGIPSAIIGFSVIALGTSLPELVTGVTAARKGVPDLSFGNIIGANVLNLLLIIGLSGVIEPLTLDPFSQLYAFPWMVVFFGLVIVLVWRNGRIERRAGSVFLALYLLFLIGLVVLPLIG